GQCAPLKVTGRAGSFRLEMDAAPWLDPLDALTLVPINPAEPFRQPGAAKESLAVAWIVLRVHVGHSPRPYRVDLDDRLLFEKGVVRHSRRHEEEAAGRQNFGLARIGLLAHPK